jgi:hypothetical protein
MNRYYNLFHWIFVKKEFRGEGAYSTLLTARINDVKEENGKIITIANSETSFPLLLKKGVLRTK